jgi:hypothetical protein
MLQAYQIFFPLTVNTNINNIQAVGLANVSKEAYQIKPSDCQYNKPTVSSSSVGSDSRFSSNLFLMPY